MTVRRVVAAAALLPAVAACTAGTPSSRAPTPEISGSEATEGLRFGDCGALIDLASAQLPAERAERLTFECGVLDVRATTE